MDHFKSIILISAATLILLIMAIGSSWLFKPQDQSQAAANTPSQNELLDAVTWETRQIYRYGFEINIPSSWALTEQAVNEERTCIFFLIESNDQKAALYLKPPCESEVSDAAPKENSVIKDYGTLKTGRSPLRAELLFGGKTTDKDKYIEVSDRIVESISQI